MGDRTEKNPVRALLQSGIEVRVTCEVRTFGALSRNCPSGREV